MIIRDATVHDVGDITHIYNDAITNTTAVWTEQTVTVDDRVRWFQDRIQVGYPVLVADDRQAVVGFASFGDFRPWPGYRATVESSVYVAADERRRGAGRLLVDELAVRARSLSKRVIVAGIEGANDASIALHRQAGYVDAGRLPGVGEKFGRTLDLVLLCLSLD